MTGQSTVHGIRGDSASAWDEEEQAWDAGAYVQLSRSATRGPDSYLGADGRWHRETSTEFPIAQRYGYRLSWGRLPWQMSSHVRQQLLYLRQDFEKILNTTICHNSGRYDDGPGRVLGAGASISVKLSETAWGAHLMQTALVDSQSPLYTSSDHPHGPARDIAVNNPKRFLQHPPPDVANCLSGRKIVYNGSEKEWWELPLDVKAEVYDIVRERRGISYDYGDVICGSAAQTAPSRREGWDGHQRLVMAVGGDTPNGLSRSYSATSAEMIEWNRGYEHPVTGFVNQTGYPVAGQWYIVARNKKYYGN